MHHGVMHQHPVVALSSGVPKSRAAHGVENLVRDPNEVAVPMHHRKMATAVNQMNMYND